MRSGMRARRRKRNKSYINILIAVLAAVAVGTTAMTLAYLTHRSGLINQFQLGEVKTEVKETFKNNVKSNVKLRNTGNVASYMRADILVYWQDKDGNVLWGTPVENTDYQITMGEGTSWVKGGDGYYYYTSPVAAGMETGELIQECKDLNLSDHQKDGKYLVVDIAVQAIQSDPADAVLEAWGASNQGSVTEVDDGNLTINTGDPGTGGGDTP